MTSFREDAFAGWEHECEGRETGDDKGDVPWWATWLGKVLRNAMEAEVVCTMGTMGALSALVFLGPLLMLTQVDAKIVVLGESFGAGGALKRARSIEEVDVLVEVDVVLLGGTVITLWAFVRFLSCVGAHVNANFGLVSE